MSRTRLIIAGLGGLFTLVLLPIATNIATSTLPEWLQPYTWLAWPAVAVLAMLAIGLVVFQDRSDWPSSDITELAQAVLFLTSGGKTPSDVYAQKTDLSRHRVLAEVRRVWIDGYLKDSLHNVVRIELGLEEKPDAVSRPWDLIVQQPGRTPQSLPPGQTMGAIFDELGRSLLILGAPGAGKTTLLLELARDLLDRADREATHPIPVYFHLSTWAASKRSETPGGARPQRLADWLVDELAERYYVPRTVAQVWTDTEKILPLLDGLDEVAERDREACVEAINTFRRWSSVPLAVCSRAADYDAMPIRVDLSGAVVIQPLSREQVSGYLQQAGNSLAGLRTVLRDDEGLWELLNTPLMLSIVSLAYQGRSAAEVRRVGSVEQQRTHLFESYTQKMFERRKKDRRYPREQTLQWLSWLAQSLMRQRLTMFTGYALLWNWLLTENQRLFVDLVPIMLFALLGSLLGWLNDGTVLGLILGLLSGSAVGILAEMILGAFNFLDPLNPLILGGGQDQALLGGLDDPLPGEVVSAREDLIHALLSFAIFVLMFGLVVGSIFWLFFGPVVGSIVTLVIGLSFGLRYGGSAYLKHYITRFLLWLKNYAPWNYTRFLDYAVERVFLRKVGGRYIFTHRLLMEYFANAAGHQSSSTNSDTA